MGSLPPLPPLPKKYGYVFLNCRLTADTNVSDVYLSRPWRPYAQAVFIHCDLGRHINPAGWNNWDNKENEKQYFMQNTRMLEKEPVKTNAFLIPIN